MRPTPAAGRFARPELQEAYELGFHQEYDHNSFTLLDRFGWMLDEAPSLAAGAERAAAMLEGAADALRALARERRDGLATLRMLDEAEP